MSVDTPRSPDFSLASFPSAARAQLFHATLNEAVARVEEPFVSGIPALPETADVPGASMEGGSRFSVMNALFADPASWPSKEDVLDMLVSVLGERAFNLIDKNDMAAACVAVLNGREFRDFSVDAPHPDHAYAILDIQKERNIPRLIDVPLLGEKVRELIGDRLGGSTYFYPNQFCMGPIAVRSEYQARDLFLGRLARELHLDLSDARGRTLMLCAHAGSDPWMSMSSLAEELLKNTPPDQRAALLSSPTDRPFSDDGRDRGYLLGCLVMAGKPWSFKLLDKYIPAWTSLVDSKGRSPLFYARSGYALRYMVSRGANPMLPSESGVNAVDFYRKTHPNNKVWNEAVASSLDSEALLTAGVVLKITTLKLSDFNQQELDFLTDLATNPARRDWTWTGTIGPLSGSWSVADMWRLTVGAARHSMPSQSSGTSRGAFTDFHQDFIKTVGEKNNRPHTLQCGDLPGAFEACLTNQLDSLPASVRGMFVPQGGALSSAQTSTNSLVSALVGMANAAPASFSQEEKALLYYSAYSSESNAAAARIHQVRADHAANLLHKTMGGLSSTEHARWCQMALYMIPKIQGFMRDDCWSASVLSTTMGLLQAAARPVHVQNGLATEEMGREALSERLGDGFRSNAAPMIWADALMSALPAWQADRDLPLGPERAQRIQAWTPLVHIGISIMSSGEAFSGPSSDHRPGKINQTCIPAQPFWDKATVLQAKKRPTPRVVFELLSESLIEMLDSGVVIDKIPVRVLKKLEPRFKAACERSMLNTVVSTVAEKFKKKDDPDPEPVAPIRRKM